MPNDLSQIAISKYLYISLAKRVFFDINISSDKNEICNLSLISNINNPFNLKTITLKIVIIINNIIMNNCILFL